MKKKFVGSWFADYEKVKIFYNSFTCHIWESSHPFATNRSDNFEFVGEIIDGNGHRKDSDFRKIKKNPGSAECIPK